MAGPLFVAGVTGVATVRALAPTPGEAVVIAWAGGGVGGFAVQRAVRTDACVIGLAASAITPSPLDVTPFVALTTCMESKSASSSSATIVARPVWIPWPISS